MLAEWEKLAREAADRDEAYEAYLLRLTEMEVAARSANAVAARIRAAGSLWSRTSTPSTSPPRRTCPNRRSRTGPREWIDQHWNCCLIGGSGTGKTHVAIAWGLALCRLGKRVRSPPLPAW